MARTIIPLALAFLLLISGLRYVPGISAPPHPIWDFYNLPPVAKGLPWNFTERDAFVDIRLRKEFPPGTKEGDIIRALRAQGFDIDAESNEARYGWISLGCVCLMMMSWNPEDFRDGEASPIVNTDAYFWPFGLPDSLFPHPL